ncbi:hypothetical protein [Trujillonella humicola]|uniref:hypothetical protein n=1 Tax=Trujillonella humicola TaxID=3383699 RepID=UPI0039061C9C
MPLVRRIGATVLALAAVVVWFAMAPEESSDRSSDITSALAEYELNEARTQGAPQQQVVNGWVQKDLLTVIAQQQNDSVTDERLPALAVLAVFGLALHIATSPRPTETVSADAVAPAAPFSPEPSPVPSQ